MSSVTDQHIRLVCSRLAAIGANAYTRADDGFYDVRLGDTSRIEPATALRDIYQRHARRGTPALQAQVDTTLKESGFTSFRWLARGTNAMAVAGLHGNGHEYAMRISSTRTRYDARTVMPLVPQPYNTLHDEDAAMRIDVLPMVQILSLSDATAPVTQLEYELSTPEEYVLETALRDAAHLAGCRGDALCRDVGVLPDGTVAQPDPGQIQYSDRSLYQDDARAAKVLRGYFKAMTEHDLPEQLRGFDADGRWKQDRFFTSPFAHVPQYRGFRF